MIGLNFTSKRQRGGDNVVLRGAMSDRVVFVKKQMKKTSQDAVFIPSVVLCAVAIIPGVLSVEWFAPLIVLLGLIIWMMTAGDRSFSYLRLTWPLWLVFIMGLQGVFRHGVFHILRDIAFALTPVCLLFIGCWIAEKPRMQTLILKLLIACSFILSVNHLLSFMLNPDLLSAEAVDVRQIAGNGAGNLVVLAFVLGVFQNRLSTGKLFFKLLPRFVALPILLASIVLSYSRTEFVVLLVVAFSLWGWLTRVKFSSLIGVGAVALSLLVVVATTPEGEIETFRGKLANSISEITVANYQNDEDINTKWRGFETARVLQSFADGSVLAQIFGQGFGALVELGFEMRLGEEYFRAIPIFHNGYAYVLIKSGLLGLVCYALFYFYVLKHAVRIGNAPQPEPRFLGRLLLACVLSLILTMYVVGGMAEAHDSILVLLLGYLMRRILHFQCDLKKSAAPGVAQ